MLAYHVSMHWITEWNAIFLQHLQTLREYVLRGVDEVTADCAIYQGIVNELQMNAMTNEELMMQYYATLTDNVVYSFSSFSLCIYAVSISNNDIKVLRLRFLFNKVYTEKPWYGKLIESYTNYRTNTITWLFCCNVFKL